MGPGDYPGMKCVRAVADALTEAFLACDREGKILVTNEAARQLFDSGGQGLENQPISVGVKHPELVSLVMEAEAGRDVRDLYMEIFDPVAGVARAFRVTMATMFVHKKKDELRILLAVRQPERIEFSQLDYHLYSKIRHEILTPLTSLRGFAELMLKRPFPKKRRNEFLQIMIGETDRLVGFLDETFSAHHDRFSRK